MTILQTNPELVKEAKASERLVIPFFGQKDVLLHAKIVRNVNLCVDFTKSTAQLWVASPDIVFNTQFFTFYSGIGDDGFLSYFDLTKEMPEGLSIGVDEWCAQNLTAADMVQERIELSLQDWVLNLHFRDEQIDKMFSNVGFDIFGSPYTAPITKLFAFGTMFPGLELVSSKAVATVLQREIVVRERVQEKGTVYLIGCEQTQTLKIGYTENLNQRIQSLQRSNPHELKLIGSKSGTIELEQTLLHKFSHLKLRGEWFKWNKSILRAFGQK